jgi:hypothetical protein
MTNNYPNFDPLRASSLRELVSQEREIVNRINSVPNGGRALLLDPQRLLRDLRVEVTPEALEEWRAAYPEHFAQTGREHAYDAVAQSRPGDEITISVNGLFRRERR